MADTPHQGSPEGDSNVKGIKNGTPAIGDDGETWLLGNGKESKSPSPDPQKCGDRGSKVALRRKKSVAAGPPVPPDGGWGWVVVLAAFVACAGVVGLTRAFGIIYVEIVQNYPNSSALAISWIPGLYNTLSTGLAPVAGALSNKYSCRNVVFVGGLLMSCGLMLNFFATSVEFLYVSFGIITGCGAGMCTTPGIIMVARYFKKRRALANGLCLAGTSSGAFIQPILVEYLTKQYGFRGAMLIMGGIMLHISAFSLVYRPLTPLGPKPPKPQREIPRKSTFAKKYCWLFTCLLDRKTYMRKTDGLAEGGETKSMLKDPSPLTIEMTPPREILGKDDESPPRDDPNADDKPDVDDSADASDDSEEEAIRKLARTRSLCLDHSVNDLTAISTAQYQEMYRRRQDSIARKQLAAGKPPGPTGICRYLDFTLFRNWAFVIFVTSSALTSVGYPHASVFMPAYATKNLHIPKQDTGYLLSITAGADLIGRIGVGYLADLNLFKKMHGYIVAVATTATATLCLPLMYDFVDMGVNSAFYGLGVGSFFMLTPVILTDNHGPEKVASSYGLLRMFHGIMSLISPPIAGILMDVTGTYTPGFIFMGIAMMCGSLVCFLMPWAVRVEERRKSLQRGSIISADYRPMGDGNINAPDERRSSLSSWGRRYSVDPEPDPKA